MSDDPKHADEPQAARIFKIGRRKFLRSSAAVAIGGVALQETTASRAAEEGSDERKAKREGKSTHRRGSAYSLFHDQRPFKTDVHELYPVLDAADSRLLAQSESGWLAIWSLDRPGRPRFKGKGSCCPPRPLALGENRQAVCCHRKPDRGGGNESKG